MSTDLDQELDDSMKSSLESLFVSLREGPNMLNGFLRTWTAFSHTVQTHRDRLKEETLESIHNFAATIGTVAAAMLELEVEKEKMRDQLAADVSNILNDQMDNLFIEEERRDSEGGKPYAAYVKPCYSWLLSNIHNPYPSKDIRNYIARETDSSRKDIDTWFTDVRKRIGWNDLRKRQFSNKRIEIVKAAICFFESRPLAVDKYEPYAIYKTDLKDDHGSDFVAIRQRAKHLYSEGFFESILQPQKSQGLTHSSSEKDFDQASSYPSPKSSPESSAPSPLPDIPRIAGRKRRQAFLDPSGSEAEKYSDRPHKCPRLDSPDTHDNHVVAYLPSPAPSLPDVLDINAVMPEANTLIPPTVLQGKRKRHSSDAGNNGPPKRPHNALAVPRLQTVSDPLPLANPIISELCQTIGDSIPCPVSVESLDDIPVEVNFYNYDTSPDIMQSFLLADSSLDPYFAAPAHLSTANSGPLSLDESQVSDRSLDFLIENYLKDVPPQALDIPFFTDIPSHDHSTLFPPFENMFPIQPPPEDILSDPYFQIPGLWDFQGNDYNHFTMVPSIGTLFSSDSIPPQIDPTQNEKEAKRKQIEALRAQIQSLEAEP